MSLYTRTNTIPPVVGIVIGFLLFEFSTALLIFSGSDRLLKLLGLLIIFYYFFKSKKWEVHGLTRRLLVWLFLIEILMVFIGIFSMSSYFDPFNGSFRSFVSNLLFFTHTPLTLLIPFAAFLSFSRRDIVWLKKIAVIVVFVQLLLLLFNWTNVFSTAVIGRTSLISETGDFITVRTLANSIFSGIGLVAFFTWNKSYFTRKSQIIFMIGLSLAFIALASGGGRGRSAMMIGYILTTIYINYSKAKFKIFKLTILISVFFAVLIYLYNNTTVFSYLLQRFFTDDSYSTLKESSREYFTASMIADFNLNPLSWIFGRGIYGAYRLTNGEYRQWMEWGFLYQILKGGGVYLIIYVSVFLYSFKKALFNSNNFLTKAMGYLCLWQVIELIPFGLPDMTAKYFLVWWFVGIISKKEIREMNDIEIINFFHKKK